MSGGEGGGRVDRRGDGKRLGGGTISLAEGEGFSILQETWATSGKEQRWPLIRESPFRSSPGCSHFSGDANVEGGVGREKIH